MKKGQVKDSVNDIELTFWIGKNAQNNWDIIDQADKNDIWFHLSDYPSAHVILRNSEKNLTIKDISKQTLKECAIHCKLNSKMRNSNHDLSVIYTEIKNVKKADKIGAVHTKNTKNIKI
jgi:Predicted RNA-binding protein homologous to eukaryotic snRNP